MKKILLSLTIVALLFAGCSKENDDSIEDFTSKYVSINATMDLSTKATATAFESGDVIGVYAWNGSDETITAGTEKKDYGYDGSDWSTLNPMEWTDLTTNYYFFGVYPTTDHVVDDFTADPFELVSNQITSDILIATYLTGMNGSNAIAVPLVFTHAMAKFTINLSHGTEWTTTPTVSSVTVSGAYDNATINYLTKVVTPTGKTTDISMPILSANSEYESVMIPQSISGDITIVIDKTDYVYTPDTPIVLTAGKNYILSLVVGHDESVTIDPDPSKTKIIEWTTVTGSGYAETDD